MKKIDFITPSSVRNRNAIFKTGGAVVFDNNTANEIAEIKTVLAGELPDSEREILEETLLLLSGANESPVINSEKIIEINHNSNISLEMLGNGNFFKQHNEKVLGTIEVTTDRYKKEIRIVKGDISNLDEIDVPENFAQFVKSNNIGATIIKSTVKEQTEDPANTTFIENVIAESKSTVYRKKTISIDPPLTQKKIQTTSETYKKLNPKISQEELRVYLFWKSEQGQQLSKEWYSIAGYGERIPRIQKNQINEWIKDGLLFYFNGEYLPKPIYLSGDIYEKISRIVKAGNNSGQDIKYIVDNYGKEVLENQIEDCNGAYSKVYSSRLIITGNRSDNSLILKPISKLSKNTFIKELQDYPSFRWYTTVGKPNWEKQDGRNEETFDELSITDAFCFYLVKMKNKLNIKGGITFLDIIQLYILKKTKQVPRGLTEDGEKKWKATLQRSKSKAREEGDRLFLKFLDEQLLLNDRIQIETSWNRMYNNFLPPDYEKIPVAFNVAREFYNENPFIIKPEKREAVSFILNEGSGCLAYDVGVGKTMSAIMIIEQFIVAGYCKRPFIVVPNQTYTQWISEVKNVLPHRIVNDYYNLGVKHYDSVVEINSNGEEVAKRVAENSITVVTYEGFKKIGFGDETTSKLKGELYEILNQGGAEEQMSKKKKAGFMEKLETLLGKGLKGAYLNIEDFGFDFVSYDEAHALKKVFTSVKGNVSEEGKRERKKHYDISSGLPSDLALKGFMISQYILKNNNDRNVLLLTATPFTNSPLEVFSMLSLVAYHKLAEMGLNNINDFFDNFIEVSEALTINHKLQPVYKQVIKGFDNLPSMQKIITRFFNYKTGEDVGVVRPDKIVIPYSKKIIDNIVTVLPPEDQVNCYLEPTIMQRNYVDNIIAFAEEKIGYAELKGMGSSSFEDEDEEVETTKSEDATEVDIEDLDNESKDKARAIISMNLSRDTALSPYLYKFHDLGEPTYKDFVEESPKILYTMKCIATVKKYHEDNGQAVSGQVIYADRGIRFFPLMKEYLVKVVGYKSHEVGFIMSKGMTVDKRKAVQDGFLGRKYDNKKADFVSIPDKDRIKVLIGSSSIREGMNLQKYSTVLYNLFVDWNPTDNIQLAGRIWRQGNTFKNVRIVNPLLIDSSDIFMFQKLEEKTSRINTIWSNDGRSALRLDEFDPEALKRSLIKDVRVLAKIEILDSETKLKDEKQFNESIVERLKEYQQALSKIVNPQTFAKLQTQYHEFRQKSEPTTSEELLDKLKVLYNSKSVKTKDGKIMLGWSERRNLSYLDRQSDKYSSFDRPYKPYWFDDLLLALRLVKKEDKNLLDARQINKDEIEPYIDNLVVKNTELEEKLEYLKSDEYVNVKAEEIEEYRRKNKIVQKSLPEVVKDFESLNYLLDFKYCNLKKSNKKPKKIVKPVVNEDIVQLDEAISNLKDIVHLFDGSEKSEIEEAYKTLEDLRHLFI